MKNRRKTADGYQRWMMKASTAGDMGKLPGAGGGAGGGRRKGGDDDDMGSDKGDDDDDDEFGKRRLNLNKAAKGGDEDGEELANDVDLDEEEPERGIYHQRNILSLPLNYQYFWRFISWKRCKKALPYGT